MVELAVQKFAMHKHEKPGDIQNPQELLLTKIMEEQHLAIHNAKEKRVILKDSHAYNVRYGATILEEGMKKHQKDVDLMVE